MPTATEQICPPMAANNLFFLDWRRFLYTRLKEVRS